MPNKYERCEYRDTSAAPNRERTQRELAKEKEAEAAKKGHMIFLSFRHVPRLKQGKLRCSYKCIPGKKYCQFHTDRIRNNILGSPFPDTKIVNGPHTEDSTTIEDL